MNILFVLLGLVLVGLFIYFYKKIALLIAIIGGLIFVAYKLGFFSWLIGKILGYG